MRINNHVADQGAAGNIPANATEGQRKWPLHQAQGHR